MSAGTLSHRVQRGVAWFLALSYALGSPAFAVVEAGTGALSERFGYSPEFLYLVAAAQFVCALVLFDRRFVQYSIAILTVLSVGAAASHFMIGSPVTSLPAIAYTALQIWYGRSVCVASSYPPDRQ